MASVRPVVFHHLSCRGAVLLVLWSMGWNMADASLADGAVAKGSLSGTIVGPDRKPVSGAKIWVNTWHNKRLAEACSERGRAFPPWPG